MQRAISVGLISDTHGLLRPQAIDALRGCDYIVHAGDIGKPEVLDALRAIAPLTAIRGNNDKEDWASALPDTAELDVGGVRIFVVHSFADLDFDPAECGFRAVVAGHSHKPEYKTHNGVLLINPGSAGSRRFRLPVAVGTITIENGVLLPQLLELAV